MKTVVYFYGISEGGADARKARPGIDGAGHVSGLEVGGLTAWYSEVDAGEYGESLRTRIEDLDWLAQASVRHQQTVESISKQTAMIPAQFGVVFRSAGSLAEHVRERAEQSRDILHKISGAEEWGVKVFRKRGERQAVAAVSGRDYLQQKAALRKSEAKGVSPEVQALAEELAKVSADTASIGKISGAQPDLEWQASFLVRKKDKAAWDAVLRRYSKALADSKSIECTGPWPPYSFVGK
ncbi:MAG: GvpL/GvpF family gas vesicle protein [Acidobacteriales bacterium]|nr:GvpL/GvpF family gas vesicle protein [Terriglobales bacterium]